MTQEEKLQKLLSLMDSDGLTEAKFKSAFNKVLEFVKKNREEITNALNKLNEFNLRLAKKIENEQLTTSNKIDNKTDKEFIRLQGEFNKLKTTIDNRMAEVKDGKDSDEDSIVEKVMEMIEVPELEDIVNSIPMEAEKIRDSLELLQGDERLDESAIKGLKERFKKLEEMINEKPLGGGGGGFSNIAMQRHFVDDETPSGTLNGVNTEFKLAKTPFTGSLKLYRNGQRLRITEDYTLSGKTITLLVAPASDEILLADYRF